MSKLAPELRRTFRQIVGFAIDKGMRPNFIDVVAIDELLGGNERAAEQLR